jgi:HlyD family secretion protein
MWLAPSRTIPVVLALALGALAACGEAPGSPTPTAAPTLAPTAGPRIRTGAVRASGRIVPALQADLSFASPGVVSSVAVAEGDAVGVGALLAQQDRSVLEAQALQASASVAKAEARLAELRAGARPEEIEAAEARLAAAQARRDRLSEVVSPVRVAAARGEVAAAQAALQALFAGPRREAQIAAEQALRNAEAALRQAQAAYDSVSWRNDIAALPQSQQLQQATNDFEAARARFDNLASGPDAAQVASARARVQQAQASLEALSEPAANSAIAEAEAQLRSLRAELDLLKAGARPEQLAAAEADVTAAQGALRQVEGAMARTELRAPFAGSISALDVVPGEMALAGQTVMTLGELSVLQVETTDLSERDVARIAVGKPATVFVEALNRDFPGKVLRIAPRATVVAGDAVYRVVVAFGGTGTPDGLRQGMSAELEIPAD